MAGESEGLQSWNRSLRVAAEPWAMISGSRVAVKLAVWAVAVRAIRRLTTRAQPNEDPGGNR
jgi:hypothetical protein